MFFSDSSNPFFPSWRISPVMWFLTRGVTVGLFCLPTLWLGGLLDVGPTRTATAEEVRTAARGSACVHQVLKSSAHIPTVSHLVEIEHSCAKRAELVQALAGV